MKKKILIRLDDACEYRNVDNWQRVQAVLTKYNVKPLVGIIPHCEDQELASYGYDENFWGKVEEWKNLGWTFALHGYNHVYVTLSGGGVHPVHQRSEFADVPLEEQCFKIREGIKILKEHNLTPHIFFAPSHTFDLNTLEAIKRESDIRIISDGIANDVYFDNGFWYIPQQIGRPKSLPLRFVTVCLHPNCMNEKDFEELDAFLLKEAKKIISTNEISYKKRKRSVYDRMLNKMYFTIRKRKKRT